MGDNVTPIILCGFATGNEEVMARLPGTTAEPCYACEAPVIVAPSTRHLMETRDALVVCKPCGLAVGAAAQVSSNRPPQFGIAPGAEDEMVVLDGPDYPARAQEVVDGLNRAARRAQERRQRRRS